MSHTEIPKIKMLEIVAAPADHDGCGWYPVASLNHKINPKVYMAAPDLLEAAKEALEILKLITATNSYQDNTMIRDHLIASIAKAEGK